ncbi:MAG: chaperone NapD [Deferribacterales bacterium]|nr:chaperone NapD [Deferribacterales bacterium]
MVFASSVVYFDEKRTEEVEELLKSFSAVEVYDKDTEKGKIVIVIEAENNTEIENIEKKLRAHDAVVDVAHYAFHFGDEVDGLLNGTIKPDTDFENFFKKKHKQ